MSLSDAAATGRPARLELGSGARETERLLLADLDHALDRLGLETLSRPVRLVVPSRSLRTHLLARVVEVRGHAVAGLSCTTLFGLARGLVEGHDGRPNLHDELALLLARRFALRESALGRPLGHLREGFRAVDGSVRDLLEAGLEPAHVEALDDALAVDGPRSEASREEIERARALVRISAATSASLEELGVLGTAALLRRAAELVRLGSVDQLPTSELFVFGFGDAIGVATDVLLALLDRYRGTIYVDQPPDPADPGRPDAGNRFTRRFTERVGDVARPAPPSDDRPRPDPPRLRVFQAVGGEAEAREVAARVRVLLDGGARAERIGVVARRLEPHRTVLRTHFGRLAIPFSAIGAPGPLGPEGRCARALLELLQRGKTAPVERWLDARLTAFARISDFDLRLALSALGAGRLEEVPGRPYRLLSRDGSYPLPARLGFTADEEDVHARRRRVPLAALESAAAAAASLCTLFDRWRSETRLEEHVTLLQQALMEDLGWSRSGELTRKVVTILDALSHGLPADLEVSFDEFVDLLRPPIENVGLTSFGGRGGGVRVLDAIEARGLTFEHLFVIGLNRGNFPRVVNEDPLLPDSLRGVISRHGFGVLQDLPQKLSGYDEERYLFSQLLSSGDQVTLSWQDVDEDNRQQTPSPLVERLRWASGREDWRRPATARPVYAADAERASSPGWGQRPSHEAAVLAGIHGDRRYFGRVLAVAVRDAAGREGRAAAGLHTARLRILEELDPARGADQARLGPYFGFVGPTGGAGDPRRRERLFVTTLESLASCSWRSFLERLLHLQPVPDPLEALPGVEPLYIGNLVHRILERIVAERVGERPASLDQARERTPEPLAWPEPEALEQLVREEAAALVRTEGFAFPGFARLLAEVTLPFLETARETEWGSNVGVRAVAAEVYGAVTISDQGGRERQISFKADRVDGGEALVLTDYKTGRPLSDKKTPAARRKRLLEALGAGERLQAAAYALAGGSPADTGRYLFLRPDPETPPDHRVAEVVAGDTEMLEAFLSASRAALAAWDSGAFLPRLLEPRGDREPRFCEVCSVREACLRGDSGARGRLRAWVDKRSGEAGADPAERAVLSVWRLRPDRSSDDWKERR